MGALDSPLLQPDVIKELAWQVVFGSQTSGGPESPASRDAWAVPQRSQQKCSLGHGSTSTNKLTDPGLLAIQAMAEKAPGRVSVDLVYEAGKVKQSPRLKRSQSPATTAEDSLDALDLDIQAAHELALARQAAALHAIPSPVAEMEAMAEK